MLHYKYMSSHFQVKDGGTAMLFLGIFFRRINKQTFLNWLKNTFYPHVKPLLEKPPYHVILFVDGHQSHVNIDVHDFCSANKIVYYVLPAHASHIVQTLDLVLSLGSSKPSGKRQSVIIR